jgi:hypothetical protein
MIPTRVTNLAMARRDYGALADMYCEKLMQGDPLADALVARMITMPRAEAQAMVERALDHGVASVPNAPQELIALFNAIDRVPSWVDWDRIALGARTYQRTGPAGSLVLSAVSLMNGYHSSAAIKPLLFTGRLDVMARRRLAETGRFIAETIQEDGLRRHSQGFKTTIKVRVVHATVRAMLQRSPGWNNEAWGLPINQADLLSTNLSFSIALVEGVRHIGLRFSKEEVDALLHLWRYSGTLSGCDVGMLPCTEEDAMRLAEMLDLMQPGPDDGSTLLANALRGAITEERKDGSLPEPVRSFLLRYHDGITRDVIGDEKSDRLGVGFPEWKWVVRGMRPLMQAAEIVRERLPFGTRLAAHLGNRLWIDTVARELEGHKADFRPPTQLAKEERFHTAVRRAA